MSRILGIDYGTKRIGIAVSDPTRTITSPLTTLQRRVGKRPPWRELEAIVRDLEVTEVVIGLPLVLSGEESEWAAEVRRFAADIERRYALPVHLYDERMTSVAAERIVRSSGLRRSERENKARIDATAAALILENYLEWSRTRAEQQL